MYTSLAVGASKWADKIQAAEVCTQLAIDLSKGKTAQYATPLYDKCLAAGLIKKPPVVMTLMTNLGAK